MEKIVMYALSTCPWCRKTKQFFKEKNIEFNFIDYDLAGEEEQDKIRNEMSKYGNVAFPFVKIGEEVVIGYDPDKYSKLCGLTEGK
ncbi:glutaredoxin [miscellaneous Crenarchaeota group archaeon SMTZ-80]|nr:MAG: glutaredoxin [miscellaneous Crenarchaeota group archaeon SMTZ-80]